MKTKETKSKQNKFIEDMDSEIIQRLHLILNRQSDQELIKRLMETQTKLNDISEKEQTVKKTVADIPSNILHHMQRINYNFQFQKELQSFKPKEIPVPIEIMIDMINHMKEQSINSQEIKELYSQYFEQLSQINTIIREHESSLQSELVQNQSELEQLLIENHNQERLIQNSNEYKNDYYYKSQWSQTIKLSSTKTELLQSKHVLDLQLQNLQSIKTKLIAEGKVCQNFLENLKESIKKNEKENEKLVQTYLLEKETTQKRIHEYSTELDLIRREHTQMKQTSEMYITIYDKNVYSSQIKQIESCPLFNFQNTFSFTSKWYLFNLFPLWRSLSQCVDQLQLAFNQLFKSSLPKCLSVEKPIKVYLFVKSLDTECSQEQIEKLKHLCQSLQGQKNNIEIIIYDSIQQPNSVFEKMKCILEQQQIKADYHQTHQLPNIIEIIKNQNEEEEKKVFSQMEKKEKEIKRLLLEQKERDEQYNISKSDYLKSVQINQKRKEQLNEEIMSNLVKLEGYMNKQTLIEKQIALSNQEMMDTESQLYNLEQSLAQFVNDYKSEQLQKLKQNVLPKVEKAEKLIGHVIHQKTKISSLTVLINKKQDIVSGTAKYYEQIKIGLKQEMTQLFQFIWALTGFDSPFLVFFCLIANIKDQLLERDQMQNIKTILNISDQALARGISDQLNVEIDIKDNNVCKVSITEKQPKRKAQLANTYILQIEKMISKEMSITMNSIKYCSTLELFEKELNHYIGCLTNQGEN